ncbi:hypothetical protein Cgig2_032671 [Carnegiea gigantea]|uniref:Uncharacterized protein n=1 Tax=Carnegiea gigantea TaxID=171969 RepID=A0A9Q1GQD6_9CARY|nr:hypothetical protein Cgig2_032671 [Carnegiea gigantea]
MGRNTTTTGPPRSGTSKRTKTRASSSSAATNVPPTPNRAQAARECWSPQSNVQDFWCEITYDKRTLVTYNHGFHVPYSADELQSHFHLQLHTQIEMFKMQGNRVFINHHGHALFPLSNPTKTNCADSSNWVYEDAIDMESDEEEPQPQEGDIGGGGGGIEGVAGSFGAIPPDEQMYEPLLTRSRT